MLDSTNWTHDGAEALLRAFVVKKKQARLIELLDNRKRRRDATRTFDHFRDLDPRFIIRLPPDEQRSESIARALALRGASDTCYIISADSIATWMGRGCRSPRHLIRWSNGGEARSCRACQERSHISKMKTFDAFCRGVHFEMPASTSGQRGCHNQNQNPKRRAALATERHEVVFQ